MAESYFPIRELSRRTGVSERTLRTWENRYQFVLPVRSDGGQRQYTDKDEEKIKRVLYWQKKGVPVGKIKLLLEKEDKRGGWYHDANGLWTEYQAMYLRILDDCHLESLDKFYYEISLDYPPLMIYLNLLLPLEDLLKKKRKNLVNFHESYWVMKINGLVRDLERQGPLKKVLLIPLQESSDSLMPYYFSYLLQMHEILPVQMMRPIELDELHDFFVKEQFDAFVIISEVRIDREEMYHKLIPLMARYHELIFLYTQLYPIFIKDLKRFGNHIGDRPEWLVSQILRKMELS